MPVPMLFLITAVNRPEAAPQRAAARADHLRFLRDARAVCVFGAAVSDLDDRGIGPLLIVDLPDRPAAEAFIARDPYSAVGGYAEVTIAKLSPRIPEPEPGYFDRQITGELEAASAKGGA